MQTAQTIIDHCFAFVKNVKSATSRREPCKHRTLNYYTGHAHPLILSFTLLRMQFQLSGTHCLLVLGLLIALVLLRLDLKLTVLQKPTSSNVSVTHHF